MAWFHRHTWKLIKATYSDPVRLESFKYREMDFWTLAWMQGCTSYLFECTDPRCGEHKTEVLLGKEPAPES